MATDWKSWYESYKDVVYQPHENDRTIVVQRGAEMEDAPMNRKSPYVPIRIREFKHVASLNAVCAFCTTMAVSLLLLDAGFIWDAVTGGAFSKSDKNVVYAFIIIVGVLCLVFVFASWWSHKTRVSEVEETLAECEQYVQYMINLEERRFRASKPARLIRFLSRLKREWRGPVSGGAPTPPSPATPSAGPAQAGGGGG